jgi:hypothetical protein
MSRPCAIFDEQLLAVAFCHVGFFVSVSQVNSCRSSVLKGLCPNLHCDYCQMHSPTEIEPRGITCGP